MELISVITSTFKRPEKLKRAIQSVIDQTYENWELIVVSDGGDKETKYAVNSFNDKRIKYLECRHFGNHSRPKNVGIKASRGEYICFLDDDNVYRPDHINVLLKGIQRERTDVVYGDRWLIDDAGKENPRIGIFLEYDPVMLFQSNYIDTSDVMIKREVLFEIGGCDERYKKFLDWNLWIRMTKAGKTFKRVPLVITDYHLSTDSMSRKKLDAGENNAPAWSPQDVEIELPFLGTIPKEPRVAIYTITYDRLEYTKKCFKSLNETTGYYYDHYIVDNNSTDGSQDWINKQKVEGWCQYRQLIPNKTNMGISIASNQALDSIKMTPISKKTTGEEKELLNYDIIIKVDNDCIFQTKGWLSTMVNLWRSNHRLAMSCYINGLRDNPGGAMRFAYGTLKGELVGMTRHLGGICHFVSADAYKTFRWPEDDTLHGFQDLYFSNYLLANGYQMGYLENYYCSHGPKGTVAQEKDYQEYFERRKKEKTIKYETNHKTI